MRKKLLIAIAFALGVWGYVLFAGIGPRLGSAALPPAAPTGPEDGITVLFSPSGGCTQAIVDELNKSKESVIVEAYSFTSQPIANAVADALARGVDVRVVLDKSQRGDRNALTPFFGDHHVPVYIDEQHGIAHNKVMVIDKKVVITGSFNFTKSSEEKNAENLLIIHDRPKLAAAYLANFEHHLDHSVPLFPGTPASSGTHAPTASAIH